MENAKNILNADVEIRGNIRCTADMVFDGKIEGDLVTEGNLNLGENTVVKGNVGGANIIARGKINGNVSARERLEIKTRTEIVGDLRAGKLVVEEGVVLCGKAEIAPAKTAPASSSQTTHVTRTGDYKPGPALGR
jgi:cytoskeletal protein CcmA (bactofilin family)